MSRVVNHKAWVALLVAAMAAAIMAALLLVDATTKPARASAFPGKNDHIAFVSNRDSNVDIYSMNPDGTHQIRLSTLVLGINETHTNQPSPPP